MNLALSHEINRLVALQRKNNHIRPEEIDLARDAQTTLTTLIQDARVRLDALQLIQGGDF